MKGQAQVHVVFPSLSGQQCLKMMIMSHDFGDTCLKSVKCFSLHIRVFPKTIAQLPVILSEAKTEFYLMWYLKRAVISSAFYPQRCFIRAESMSPSVHLLCMLWSIEQSSFCPMR